MRVRFWGTRGSLPVALTAAQVRDKIAQALLAAGGRRFENLEAAAGFAETLPFEHGQTYGGATSCVQIEIPPPAAAGAPEYLLCDLGSGARAFGQSVLAQHGSQTPLTFHIFMSHLHWDHIMGFPFFTPAYLPGNTVRIYGCHDQLRAAFERQQDVPSFPVPLSFLGARLEFVTLDPGQRYEIGGLAVTAMRQLHAGDSYGYRFEHGGRALVYSTDSEHKLDDAAEMERCADFFRDADLVIFDTMYSLADAVSVKEDWGHSSNMVAVELCQLAGARHLVLFHHEPVFDDAQIARLAADTRRLETLTREGRAPLTVTAAHDGLELAV